MLGPTILLAINLIQDEVKQRIKRTSKNKHRMERKETRNSKKSCKTKRKTLAKEDRDRKREKMETKRLIVSTNYINLHARKMREKASEKHRKRTIDS